MKQADKKRHAGQQPYKGQALGEAGPSNPVSQLSGALAGLCSSRPPA